MSAAGRSAGPFAGRDLRGEWAGDFPMSRLSSWHAGGPAEWLYRPADLGDVSRLLAAAHGAMPVLAVGKGTNLLVRDGGVRGVAVRTGPALDWVSLGPGKAEVSAGAGAPCPKVAKFSVDHGLAGGEFLCGIPGTIGGALAMNAGCHGAETWERVGEVEVVRADGRVDRLGPSAFDVGYRGAQARGKTPVLFGSARLRLSPGDREAARRVMAGMMRRRRATQPLGEPSSGSVFRNPPGDAAGRLIEACGLKGLSVGDAEISRVHANFIVNRGRASASDIEGLIERVRAAVAERAGVRLELEVRIVGDPR